MMGFCTEPENIFLLDLIIKKKNAASSTLDIAAVNMVMFVVFWLISLPYTDTYKQVKNKTQVYKV